MSQSKNTSKIFGSVEIINYMDSNNQKIINVAIPTDPLDAANKEYVDSNIQSFEVYAGQGLTNTNQTFSVNNNLPFLNGVGTLISGNWCANTISVNYGGTGTGSFNSNQLLMGNGSNPLRTFTGINISNNSLIISTPTSINTNLYISNNTTIGGSLNVNNNLSAFNATIQNLNIPGITLFSNIQSYSTNFTNSTITNLVSINTTLNNLSLVNITTNNIVSQNTSFSNMILSYSTISNIFIPSSGILSSNFITSNNLQFNYATGNNLLISKITSANSIIINGTSNSHFINYATISNFVNNNSTISNLYSFNLSVFNNNSLNFSSSNAYISNLTASSIYTNNLNLSNLSIQNNTLTNINSNNITSTNLTILTNTNLNNSIIQNSTINSLNIINEYVNYSTISNLYNNNLISLNLFNTNITSNSINVNELFTNNINTINFTTQTLLSQYATISNIYAQNISSNNLININSNILNSTIGTIYNTILNSLYISSGSISVSSASINIQYTTKGNFLQLYSTQSNSINSIITNASIYLCNSNYMTISNLIATNSALFKKQLNAGNNFSSYPLTTSGCVLNINPYNFTDNLSTSSNPNPIWVSNYINIPTISAVNSNITTTKAANMYIKGKPIPGPNQQITYSTNLALGFVNNSTGGNLSGQIMFERYDGNWFSSIYVDSNDQFVFTNASIDSGINLNVYQGNSIVFSNIPNSSNITPTPFMSFSSNISQISSTMNSTCFSSASLILNGGISVKQNLLANLISTSTLLTTNISTSNIISNNFTAANICISSTLSSTNISTTNFSSTNISTGTIYSNTGIIGPTFLLQHNYIDVTVANYTSNFTNSNSIIFTEPGNPGIYSAIGNSGGFGTSIISNTSNNDIILWNKARLIIRGVSLNTATTGSIINLQPYILSVQSQTINVLTQFSVTDSGTFAGYSTWISPWFSTNQISEFQSLGLFVLSNNNTNNVRIGPTYIQYS